MRFARCELRRHDKRMKLLLTWSRACCEAGGRWNSPPAAADDFIQRDKSEVRARRERRHHERDDHEPDGRR
jgi:hypothetical protein